MLKNCVLVSVLAFLLIGSSEVRAQLVGLWQFDDGTANDSSAAINHGAFQNGATTSANTPALLGGGLSLQVNGGMQHVLVPHNTSLDISSAMTIAAWVRTVGNVQWDGILAKSPDNGSGLNHAGNYELRIENGSRLPTFLWEQTAPAQNDTTSVNAGVGNIIPNDVWTHLAITTDGLFSDFYIDGNLVASQPMPPGFGEINTNPLYIGSRADLFTTMDGFLDDVAIFNRELSQQEIQTIRTGDFTAFGVGVVPEPSSIVIWSLVGLVGVGFGWFRRKRNVAA